MLVLENQNKVRFSPGELALLFTIGKAIVIDGKRERMKVRPR